MIMLSTLLAALGSALAEEVAVPPSSWDKVTTA